MSKRVSIVTIAKKSPAETRTTKSGKPEWKVNFSGKTDDGKEFYYTFKCWSQKAYDYFDSVVDEGTKQELTEESNEWNGKTYWNLKSWKQVDDNTISHEPFVIEDNSAPRNAVQSKPSLGSWNTFFEESVKECKSYFKDPLADNIFMGTTSDIMIYVKCKLDFILANK